VENLLRKMDGQSSRKAMCSTSPLEKKLRRTPGDPYHPARVLMQDFTGVPAVVTWRPCATQ